MDMANAPPESYHFVHYLEAKRPIDDRSLNPRCWARLVDWCRAADREGPLRVIEAGAGIGTMAQRLAEAIPSIDLQYTAVDLDGSLLAEARARLTAWGEHRGGRSQDSRAGALDLKIGSREMHVEFVESDIFEMEAVGSQVWDVLIAHSFLDLVDLEAGLPTLRSLLRTGGVCYFSLVFDGLTIFRPVLDEALDQQIIDCYHRSMDSDFQPDETGRHSVSGRILLETLVASRHRILCAGSSDWIVAPPYQGDEAYFLHHILHFIEDALSGCSDLKAEELEGWLRSRHGQVERGELIYIAHQLDLLASV
jgi:SAM-dependent methyltransferase